MEFREIMRTARKGKMSLEKLAEVTGISKSLLYYYEAGKVVPALDKADKILEVLGASMMIGKCDKM